MMSSLLRPTALVCLAAMLALAHPAESQERRTKRLRAEVGYSANHGGGDEGISGALRFAVSGRGNDAFRFETGLLAGYPFLGADLGIELRYPSESSVGLVLRAGGGLLVEDGFIGPFFRAGGGVEWTVTPRIALRATGQRGRHGGVGGPHVLYLGLDYRW
ncbi:MAG TPA: hypothetical protein VK858_18025 [Longimicrobiales bacterium]|nr:hypothetical protein [Longimicrobiales bacterium]